mgnify:CR=1 FL=1
MDTKIVEFLQDQDFIWFSTEEHFNEHYPKDDSEFGVQPNERPDSYPCMGKPVGYDYNPDGRDEYIMSYIYF